MEPAERTLSIGTVDIGDPSSSSLIYNTVQKGLEEKAAVSADAGLSRTRRATGHRFDRLSPTSVPHAYEHPRAESPAMKPKRSGSW